MFLGWFGPAGTLLSAEHFGSAGDDGEGLSSH